MKNRKTKYFLALGLVMGLGVLYGCDNASDDYEINQNVYNSYQECMQDWGVSAQDAKQNGFDDLCQPSTANNNTTVNTFIHSGGGNATAVYYTGPRYYTLPNGTVRTFYRRDGKTFIGCNTAKAPSVGKTVDTQQSYTDTHANSSSNNNNSNNTNKAKISEIVKNDSITSKQNVSRANASHFELAESSIHTSSVSHSSFGGEHGSTSVARSGFGAHATSSGHSFGGG